MKKLLALHPRIRQWLWFFGLYASSLAALTIFSLLMRFIVPGA